MMMVVVPGFARASLEVILRKLPFAFSLATESILKLLVLPGNTPDVTTERPLPKLKSQDPAEKSESVDTTPVRIL